MANLLSFENAAALLAECKVYRDKETCERTIRDLLNGNLLTDKRGINIMGPEGIGKTEAWKRALRNHASRLRAIWGTLDDADKLHFMGPMTTDRRDIDGTLKFKPPWETFTGSNTIPAFLYKFRQCRAEGFTAFFDDYAPFAKRSVDGELVRLVVHQALDTEQDGMIDMTNFTNLGDNWQYLGFVINNWNRRMYEEWDGQIPVVKLLTRALRDRFIHYEICFEREQIRDYIMATAFVHHKGMGLWKYLIAPSDMTYPDNHPDPELAGKRAPFDERGLGFTRSDDEAIAMILDVMTEFFTYWERLEHLSYRTLRERLAFRMQSTDLDEWKRTISYKLMPADR